MWKQCLLWSFAEVEKAAHFKNKAAMPHNGKLWNSLMMCLLGFTTKGMIHE